MKDMNSREEFLARFEASKRKKQEMIAKMKDDLTLECENRMGKKPISFFVL